MRKKMETTIVYWASIGIMEEKMETTTYGLVFRDSIGLLEFQVTSVGIPLPQRLYFGSRSLR